MLSPGETRPGQEPVTTDDGLFRSLTRLVARSGLQFIDGHLPRHAIDGAGRRFVEVRIELRDDSVWALADASDPASADLATLQIDGRTAVRAALDRWLPLPLLRFIGRDGTGRPRFDSGPSNWARFHLAADPRDGAVKVVVVVDTEIDARSRLDVDTYVMPTVDDLRFGSTFAVSDDPVALADFLAEPWVQAWLAEVFGGLTPGEQRPIAPRSAGLLPVAAYLTVLRALHRGGHRFDVQFFDARSDVAPPIPVDLVLDVGTCRTAGLLVEAAGPDARDVAARTRLLAVRDLSRPARRSTGVVDSRITFVRPNFGNEALSRRSGRADAFRWPSLVRLGLEAHRLMQTSHPDDGAITVGLPRAHIGDLTEREDVWRFAMDPRRRLARAPMIAGPLLAHVPAVAGLLPAPTSDRRGSLALRPRFSLSATMSFLITEVLLQALAQINAPGAAEGAAANGAEPGPSTSVTAGPRALRHIILTLPLAMPLAERQLMRERAEAAIDMVWSTLGWDAPIAGFAPPRPGIRLGLDETLSAQLVHLYDDIGHRFGGDARGYLDTLGRSRPEFGVQPCLRVAGLDVGGGHAHLTIVTYAQAAGEPIAPTLFGVQRSRSGIEAVLDRVITDLLWPCLRARLAELGHPQAAGFLAVPAEPLAQRLDEQWLRPAACRLVELVIGLDGSGPHARWRFALGDLVDGANADTAAAVAAQAAGEGAPGLVLAQLEIPISDVALRATLEAALAPMVEGLLHSIVAADCDLVLLSGWGARLPVLGDLIRRHRGWRPDRVVVLTDRAWGRWYPLSPADRALADGKDLALVGALLGLGGADRFGLTAFGEGAGGAADLSTGWSASDMEPAR
jgi:hypothetical protein